MYGTSHLVSTALQKLPAEHVMQKLDHWMKPRRSMLHKEPEPEAPLHLDQSTHVQHWKKTADPGSISLVTSTLIYRSVPQTRLTSRCRLQF